MSKLTKLITHPRIIILLAFLVLSIIIIHPRPFSSAAAIRSIEKGSPALQAGMTSPDPSASLLSREIILAVDANPTRKRTNHSAAKYSLQSGSGNLGYRSASQPGIFQKNNRPLEGTLINSVDDYYAATSGLGLNQTIVITTDAGRYTLTMPASLNHTLGSSDLGINVYDMPTSNLRKGLDLEGGTRVLLKPERELTDEESSLIIDVLERRLNVYGLSDIIVREAADLSGQDYFLIEIAGANEEDVRALIAEQGKFEAKIGNTTVFRGGGDVTYVCRSARCSGISFRRGACSKTDNNTYSCRFVFSIALSPEAARRQAAATEDLDVLENTTENHTYRYLSEKLALYLDDKLVDELNIAESLQGRAETAISISGSGNGTTHDEAVANALDKMKTLQTVLTTGSLPVKLSVVKADSLSPIMGNEFLRNALKVGLFAILAVILIVFLRYRKAQIAIPMVLSMLSELIIILGVAALIKWNLDLAAIAGIIVAIGTGVDDLIVLSDEVDDEEDANYSWETRRKNAFFIIMAAYFTTIVAMVPLLFAGAGLLRGFALTTIIGITAGVFIVRPAFAVTIKTLMDI
ncbi:MAG: hypothetical protein GXP63_05830 [DPANN group archaeon]|nr:hypothetical protein [DPANN group archaeon]